MTKPPQVLLHIASFISKHYVNVATNWKLDVLVVYGKIVVEIYQADGLQRMSKHRAGPLERYKCEFLLCRMLQLQLKDIERM
jgi:hypothetical protein